jgi:hypothetical protein
MQAWPRPNVFCRLAYKRDAPWLRTGSVHRGLRNFPNVARKTASRSTKDAFFAWKTNFLRPSRLAHELLVYKLEPQNIPQSGRLQVLPSAIF